MEKKLPQMQQRECWMSHSESALADLWAHDEQPVDSLLQVAHAVVGCNIPKHRDLIKEAL